MTRRLTFGANCPFLEVCLPPAVLTKVNRQKMVPVLHVLPLSRHYVIVCALGVRAYHFSLMKPKTGAFIF
jgi:hypothetical protein